MPYTWYRYPISVQTLLQIHHLDVLPPDSEENTVRIKIRRRHVLEDTLHKLRNGLDLSKRLRVIFLGEPAIDVGGPMREYLHLLIATIARKNSWFCGRADARVPMHSVMELEKQTFLYIGKIIALSLLYGGPAPAFFSPAVADYIAYGVLKVKATVDDLPDIEIKKKAY